MEGLPNMRDLMTELDNNVFIKKWHCLVDELYIRFYIYYIDHSKNVITFVKESTEEEVRPQVLHFVERRLKEEGWVKDELEIEDKYNPAEDPYYKQQWLYVNAEIK